MPIEHINKTDTLNEGREKINEAIDGANAADVTSKEADTKATQALANSESTQTQLDTIVIDGDSSVEAAQARVDEKGVPHPTLKARIDDGMNSVNQQLAETTADLNSRGVNLRSLGAKLDGVTDDHAIVMSALAEYKHVIIPTGGVLAVSEPIIVGQGMSLEGAVPNTRGYYESPAIKYIGEENNREALIIVGRNLVGEEPTGGADNVVLRNLLIDGNDLIGFGVYATYLTNESIIDNIVIRSTLEYNGYFANAWFATIKNITSLACRDKGLAFGIPIQYLNGTKVEWTSSSPYEMNAIKIDNLRSHRAGQYYSEENPGIFDPTSPTHRVQGYGIGFGIGNGFRATNFQSELSGGIGLYVYTSTQPLKTIKSGYLERNCLNSGLTNDEMCNMLIDHVHHNDTGGLYKIEDVYFHPNSGGIYHTGSDREVLLRNLHQPQFLKSLDGLTPYELYKFVLKDNVYYLCGQSNTDERGGRAIYETVNTRYNFSIELPQVNPMYNVLFMENPNNIEPIGGYRITDKSGNSNSYSYPSTIPSDEYVFVRFFTGNAIEISKSGGTEERNAEIDFRIVTVPTTYGRMVQMFY